MLYRIVEKTFIDAVPVVVAASSIAGVAIAGWARHHPSNMPREPKSRRLQPSMPLASKRSHKERRYTTRASRSVVLQSLQAQLAELEALIPQATLTSEGVSAVSVGWHIAHCCRAITLSVQMAEASDPALFSPRLSIPELYVMTTGRIPRGKAKAPKEINADGPVPESTLRQDVTEAKAALATLALLPKKKFFTHPIFGHMRTRATARFMRIHTKHHLRIIRDILGAAEGFKPLPL